MLEFLLYMYLIHNISYNSQSSIYVSHSHIMGLRPNLQWDLSIWYLVKAQTSQIHQTSAKSIYVSVSLPSVKVEKETA